MDKMIVTPEVDPNGRYARAIFNSGADPVEWQMPEDYGPGFSNDGSSNFAALATVPFAMAQGRDIHIRGQVCPILLSNLERIVINRAAFHPRAFKRIRITADETDYVKPYNHKGPHIAAFSGGVDATYCIGKNAENTSSYTHRPVGAAVTIRGFGYDIDGEDDFERARMKATTLAKRYGFDAYAMICNAAGLATRSFGVKKFSGYQNSHPMFIASCLSLFSEKFAGALFAADYSYLDESDILKWPSHSVVHPLLSSSGFPINAVGAEVGRSEKLSFLHENDLLADIVLCHKSRDLDKNCGKCAKCKRTIMMCLSRDIDPTDLFHEIPNEDELVNDELIKFTEFAFSKSTLRYWESSDHKQLREQVWEEVTKYAEEDMKKSVRRMRRKIGPVPQVQNAPPKSGINVTGLKRKLVNLFQRN